MYIKLNSNQAQQLLEILDERIYDLNAKAYECRRNELEQAKVITECESLENVRKQLLN